MHIDKDRSDTASEGFIDGAEEGPEATLGWLLDMEIGEPEEKLFALADDDFAVEGLTPLEAEMAARPLVRGRTDGDDLSGLVGEEIVISSEQDSSSIYDTLLAIDGAPDEPEAVDDSLSASEAMTIDHSRPWRSPGRESTTLVDEGSDILGLADDDDMGEKFLALKRVRVGSNEETAETTATQDNPTAQDNPTTPDNPTTHGTATQQTTPQNTSVEDDFLGQDDDMEWLETAAAAAADDHIGDTMDITDDWPDEGDINLDTDNAWPDTRAEAADQPGAEAVAANAVAANAVAASAVADAFVAADAAADTAAQDTTAALAQEPLAGDDAPGHDAPVEAAPEAPTEIDPVQEPAATVTEQQPEEQPAEVAEAPGECPVSNEEPAREVRLVDAEPTALEDVFDYVAANQPPVDDEEFDQYLLRGEHLQDKDTDLDDLVVKRTEGIASVDPSSAVEIDYHEDFHSMGGLGSDSLAAITAVISPVMDEISSAVKSRLQDLQLGGEALEVDVMLGSDAATVAQCQAEGYEPVTAICAPLPQALQALGRTEIDALYLRLFHAHTEDSWNRLFDADFATPGAQPTQQASSDTAPPLDATQGGPDTDTGPAIFDDELLAIDPSAGLDDKAWQEESDDFEALFSGFGAADEDHIPDDDLLAGFLDVAIEEEPTIPVFDEDIFATDMDVELQAAGDGDNSNIDALFDSLGKEEQDSGDICGVEVEEFCVQDEPEEAREMVAELTTGQAEKAPPRENEEQGADLSWCIPEGISFNYTSQSSNEIFADFLDAFLEEGSAELEKLEVAVGNWESDATSTEAPATIGRILHTLKGIAKGVGLQRYGTLIHNFETLLEGLAGPQELGVPEYFRIIHAWLDAAVCGLEHVQDNRADIASEFPVAKGAAADPADTQRAQVEPEAAPDAATGEQQTASPDISMHMLSAAQRAAIRQKRQDKKLADDGAKALAAQQSVRITSEKLDHLLNLTNQAQQLGVRSGRKTVKSKRAAAELQNRLSSVRAHIAKIADKTLLTVNARGGQQRSELDALEMDQYSELQEAANILRESVEDLADLADIASRQAVQVEALLKQQAAVVSTIGSSIQGARVVPISRMMPGLRRIVRTVGADLDKSVSFRVINEMGALDRDNYARCQIILEHMVRNALDHGIESAQERLAAGKATAGRITIDVRKAGADYIITLADDGRGIDPEAMREAAYEKGLDIDVDELTDDEAIKLIFHKGFSTASALSEVSGRGVGMDIVLSELQQIGGDVEIRSTVGQGTSFEIRIPSNVTVNGALLVTAGDNSYAIPLDGLIAVEHVAVEDFFTAVEEKRELSLCDMSCEPAYLATLCHGASLPDRSTWGSTVPVMIAGSEDRYMAIAIDDVEEALELVIRSFGVQFANVPGVAGGATTADGEAIVALDLNVLVASVSALDRSPVAVEKDDEEHLMVLVVDDSRTQRMVSTSQFDSVGVETVTAENGMVAIDLLNATHRLPDVVLLDVEMPVKDGIQTLREIRKSQRFSHLPVIMVTSRTGAKHRALAEQAGCNGYMGKPFNFPQLIEQINELTGHKLQLS